jgi:hypothetical protein
MSFATEISGVSIVGFNETQPSGENPLLLSRDGSVPAASISVPVGESLVIGDWINSAGALCPMRLQKTVDGGLNWFDMALMRCGANDANRMDLETPLIVEGGVGVAVRVLADPQVGSGDTVVMSTLRCQTQP